MNDLSDRALISIQEARRYVFRNENDASRDDLLIDAVNYVSDEIWDECGREFLSTTVASRDGTDGVTDGTTSFVAASGAFVTADEGALIDITTKGTYRIVTVTNGTTVVLDGSPSADTDLTWAFGEERVFAVGQLGLISLAPYDLRAVDQIVLYSDRASASQDTLTSDEYRLLPIGGALGGTYLSVRTIAPAIAELHHGFGWEAAITGFWGMSAVPEGVKFAAGMWVKNIIENPGSYASAAMSGYVVTPEADTATVVRAGMPPAVRHRLARWRRGGLVA